MKNLILTTITALALIGCTSSLGYEKEPLTERDKEVHDTILKLKLKDYSRAQFLGSPQVAANPKGGRIICGVVNAPNSFGGFNGYQAYAVQYVPSNPKIQIFYAGRSALIDCRGAGIELTITA